MDGFGEGDFMVNGGEYSDPQISPKIIAAHMCRGVIGLEPESYEKRLGG